MLLVLPPSLRSLTIASTMYVTSRKHLDASLLIVKSPVLSGGKPPRVPPVIASKRISYRTSIDPRTLAQSHSPLLSGGKLSRSPSLRELHVMSINALTVARTSEQLPS